MTNTNLLGIDKAIDVNPISLSPREPKLQPCWTRDLCLPHPVYNIEKRNGEWNF